MNYLLVKNIGKYFQGLLEFILLNIDFNYEEEVPNSGQLQFRYCC